MNMNEDHVVEFCGALEMNTTLQSLSLDSCMSLAVFLRSHFCFCLLTLFNHQALVKEKLELLRFAKLWGGTRR